MTILSMKELALVYLRAGNLTFGGGDPTMAVLQRELVSRRGCLDAGQYGTAYSLARVTPGTNILAFCAGSGWMLRGTRGAIAAVLAVSVPSAALAVWLTYAYETWRSHALVTAATGAMAAAATGMMAAGATLLLRQIGPRSGWTRAAVIAGGAVLLAGWARVPPLQILAGAAAAGFLWGPRRP